MIPESTPNKQNATHKTFMFLIWIFRYNNLKEIIRLIIAKIESKDVLVIILTKSHLVEKKEYTKKFNKIIP